MIVLGISETHCATAAVLRDGAVVGCASEERFSRLKNDAGYPRLAVGALLGELGLSPSAIDRVVLAGTRIPSYEWMNRVMRDDVYRRRYYGVGLEVPRRGLTGRTRKLGAKLGLLDSAPGKAALGDGARRGHVTSHLGLADERVSFVDHHACHAAAAYFGSPFTGSPALVLTNDNSGDGLCGTVSSARGVSLTRHEATPSSPGSLGSFYTLVTLLLGMKPGEHEYKVMGLAPYAPERETERAVTVLSAVFAMAEGSPSRFEWRTRGPLYRALLEATLGLRFDGIAGGAQRVLEDALLRWARLARQRYGGERLALGGGVFMNVKANMLIADESWVGDLFVFPSCGDESNAVGAAYLGYLDLCAAAGANPTPRPLGPAYLGPDVRDAQIAAVIRARDLGSRYRVSEHAEIEAKIADLLVSDGVVARCAGRMEFGARARQPLDPRQPVGPPGGRRDQPDDQEPRLLDAVRADGAPRAGVGLPAEPQGAGVAVHDAGVSDEPEAARRDRRGDPSARRDGARPHPRRGLESSLPSGDPRVREPDGYRRRAQHLVQPPRRAAGELGRGCRRHVRALGAAASGARALADLQEVAPGGPP